MAKAPGSNAIDNSPQAAILGNRQNRAALLARSPRMRKKLGVFNTGGTPSGTTRVKLQNVGITTRLILDVKATIDIGTATASLSDKGPWNLLNRVKVTDFDGVDRINASGYQLWVLNSNRYGNPYGYNNGSLTAVAGTPTVPTAVGTTQTLEFLIEVPIAFDPLDIMGKGPDLRGALLTQTAVGEAYLSIDWNSLLYQNGNDDAVYNGAGTTTVVQSNGTLFQVTVFQEFILPQADPKSGKVPLPMLDLMTVYEFAGAMRSSDNIAVNTEKLFNFPNVRAVIGAYFNFINNSTMNPATTDISQFRVIANGNNIIREYNATDKLHEQRMSLSEGGDLRKGTYWELFRDTPIQTALYGAFQYGITPSSVSGTCNFEVGYESFYTKGSTLPGLSQASG